ncbi:MULTISPECIES: YcxB family protein [Bacillus]|uniref:YcxB-like C-terminal domain-containing protein n=2 Tax=Bacillus TaxID=1386 RepID=A0A0M4G8V8_9BACI|nr:MULTISPECIES: YcxB family protein [Bacillus]ALC81708.1 hypothetical protein AM592_08885 [Bacillus gobiensis]MED1094634.1 YcxB family protein [Bacillus capparidis]
MELHYQLEPNDIWAYRKKARTSSRRLRNRLRLIYLLVPILAFIMYTLDVWSVEAPIYLKIARVLFHTFLWSVVIFPLLEQFVYYLRFKLSLKEPGVLDERKISMNENGIMFDRGKETSFYRWNELVRVIDDKSYYFLYVEDLKAITIPKKTLSASQSQQEFHSLLIQYAKPLIQQYSNQKKDKLSTKNRVVLLIIYLLLVVLSKMS